MSFTIDIFSINSLEPNLLRDISQATFPTSTVLSFSACKSGQVGSKLRSAISLRVVAVQQWLQFVHPKLFSAKVDERIDELSLDELSEPQENQDPSDWHWRWTNSENFNFNHFFGTNEA